MRLNAACMGVGMAAHAAQHSAVASERPPGNGCVNGEVRNGSVKGHDGREWGNGGARGATLGWGEREAARPGAVMHDRAVEIGVLLRRRTHAGPSLRVGGTARRITCPSACRNDTRSATGGRDTSAHGRMPSQRRRMRRARGRDALVHRLHCVESVSLTRLLARPWRVWGHEAIVRRVVRPRARIVRLMQRDGA